MKKTTAYIFSAIVLIGAFFLGSKLYKQSQNEKLSFLAEKSSQYFVRNYAPRFGTKEAKVFLVEYLDPECESCRALYPAVKSLLQEFSGKVQLVVRYAPFHGNSKIAIKALEAARLQGKYWEALELLFEKQPLWGSHHNPRIDLIFDYLPSLGLDMNKLKADMNLTFIQENLDQDVEDLKTLGVRGTPSFFVNGKTPSSFGVEPLRDLLKEEVAKYYP